MTLGFIIVPLAAIALLWALLNWREKRRVEKGLERHSGIRLVFAATALLAMLFSGGCGSIFLISWIADGARSNNYVTWQAIAVLSLPPLLAGVLIWWLAMRRKTG